MHITAYALILDLHTVLFSVDFSLCINANMYICALLHVFIFILESGVCIFMYGISSQVVWLPRLCMMTVHLVAL